jgi:hypothetical protein
MRLYRETSLAFTVSDPLNPNNYPIYIVDHDLGNCILSIDDDVDTCIEEGCIGNKKEKEQIEQDVYNTGVWKKKN